MKRIISLALALAMTFSLLTTAFATDINREEAETITRVGEVAELRECNSDTYALSDGSYQCVVYAEDKYFPDEDGNLIEIDNTLVATDYNTESSNYGYKNSANSFDVYFAENAPSVFITSEESSIAFTLIGATNTTAVVGGYSSADLAANGNAFASVAGYSLQGRNYICYPDVFPSTDIVYSVENGSLKEYIIIKNPNASTEFSFLLDTINCTVEEHDGNIGFFNNDGEEVFQFASLFAVDKEEEYSPPFSYTLTENDDCTTTVTFSIPSSYLNNVSRSFPILVDPSIMVTGSSCTYDTYVSSKYPSTNYYLNNYLRTGMDDDYYIRRSYIKFDIPASASKNIASALIYMRKYSGATPSVSAYRITSEWSSSSVTWNSKPSYTTAHGSNTATLKSDGWYSLDVTRIVSLWQKGVYSNYGFLIKDSTEDNTSHWTTFYSSDAASPNKPELRIVYMPFDTALMAYKEYNADGTVKPRNDYFSSVKSYVSDYRNGSVNLSFFTACTYSEMVNRMQSSLIYFVHTHGSQGTVYLGNNTRLTINNMKDVDLSNLRCALLLTCSTGEGGYSTVRVRNNTPVNIVERLVICGAKTVIGFSDTTKISDCNIFAEEFAQRTMCSGYSIYNAIRNMDCTNFINNMSQLAVIGGVSSQTLNW